AGEAHSSSSTGSSCLAEQAVSQLPRPGRSWRSSGPGPDRRGDAIDARSTPRPSNPGRQQPARRQHAGLWRSAEPGRDRGVGGLPFVDASGRPETRPDAGNAPAITTIKTERIVEEQAMTPMDGLRAAMAEV